MSRRLVIVAQQAINVAYDLKSKESRRNWETAFNASVVTPVLTVCPIICSLVLNLLRLFYYLFEFFPFLLRTLRRRFNVVWRCWLATSDLVGYMPHVCLTRHYQ